MKVKDKLLGGTSEPALNVGATEAAEPNHTDGEGLLTAAEVAKLSTLDLKTIDRRVRDGRFPAPVMVSDRRRAWRRSDVNRWIADPSGWVSF